MITRKQKGFSFVCFFPKDEKKIKTNSFRILFSTFSTLLLTQRNIKMKCGYAGLHQLMNDLSQSLHTHRGRLTVNIAHVDAPCVCCADLDCMCCLFYESTIHFQLGNPIHARHKTRLKKKVQDRNQPVCWKIRRDKA